MNDITASIAAVQLSRIDAFIERRRDLSNQYGNRLRHCPSLVLQPELNAHDVPYFLLGSGANGRRNELARALLKAGVYATFRYWPLHRTTLYRSEDSFPGAGYAADSTLLLPLHPSLTGADVAKISAEIIDFLSR